ncbi:hypothetical protein AVEN_267268-1 [Araneus ventricosus]|uniref:Uncharacterized protein n=1 Tax=Araneus ventricosus TaxID=182803 RepID=A0A4Y2M9Q4_ARAVE|nr:hypothetical protein AVEN_267268-1 [Araneus ventricosus]
MVLRVPLGYAYHMLRTSGIDQQAYFIVVIPKPIELRCPIQCCGVGKYPVDRVQNKYSSTSTGSEDNLLFLVERNDTNNGITILNTLCYTDRGSETSDS